MARRRTGLSGLTDDLRRQARAWADETAIAQGFPARVVRPDVLRSVAVLLGRGRAESEASGAPDRRKPRRVETIEAPPAWSNDDMIDDGGDDLLLAG